MPNNSGVYMKGPTVWPFKQPIVPGRLMPSMKTYSPDATGIVYVDPRDVSILLSYSFFLVGASSGELSDLSDVADDIPNENDVVTFFNGMYRPKATGGGSSILQRASLLLTSTQRSRDDGETWQAGGLLSLNSSPATIIDAPAAHKIILPVLGLGGLYYKFGTVQYSDDGNGSAFIYGNDFSNYNAKTPVAVNGEEATRTVDKFTIFSSGGTTTYDIADVVGKQVSYGTYIADMTDGDGAIMVIMYYNVADFSILFA